MVIVINNIDKQVGLYSGGPIFGMRGTLVHVVGLHTGGGGLYSREGLYLEVYGI